MECAAVVSSITKLQFSHKFHNPDPRIGHDSRDRLYTPVWKSVSQFGLMILVIAFRENLCSMYEALSQRNVKNL